MNSADVEDEDVENDDYTDLAVPLLQNCTGGNQRKAITPLPHDTRRKKKTNHLPAVQKDGKFSRCRLPGCDSNKCRVMCSTCKVYLCLNNNRNCFKSFHEV